MCPKISFSLREWSQSSVALLPHEMEYSDIVSVKTSYTTNSAYPRHESKEPMQVTAAVAQPALVRVKEAAEVAVSWVQRADALSSAQ